MSTYFVLGTPLHTRWDGYEEEGKKLEDKELTLREKRTKIELRFARRELLTQQRRVHDPSRIYSSGCGDAIVLLGDDDRAEG